jgi:DNA-binding NtrC family response regulator/tetratricopeptide (TPR) repeat protein
MVLGLVSRDSGQMDDAIRRLQQSERLAKEHGQLAQAGLSALIVFRILAERQSQDVANPMLSDVRRLVIRAGDPHLTALLHETVARQETQSGNLDEARRHLRIATRLISEFPNAWLEQYCALNAFCLDFYACDLVGAQQHLEHALALTPITGALESAIANNEGHLYLQFGHVARAEKTLARVVKTAHGEPHQSALEGLARLYLISNRHQECEIELDRLRDLQGSSGMVTSFPFRASLVTRVRLRLTQRRWDDAMVEADYAIREGEKVSDRNIVALALFLKAQAFSAQSKYEESARATCSSSELGVWTIREYQSILADTTADHMCRNNRAFTRRYRERASRIRLQHGYRPSDAERSRAAESRAESGTLPSFELATLTDALASAFDLAYSPKLIGGELTEAIKMLGCSPRVTLLDERGNDSIDTAMASSLVLGEAQGSTTVLRCDMPADPDRALLLSGILRVGRSALMLERYRQEERDRAALWPADPVEEQGGALFVAEEMQTLLKLARRVAPTTVPVLITGETGTGKEVLARTIHTLSTRARSTFLPFNCTSTPKDMLDSQLFGHRRGAFTGASEHFQGVIRAAGGGTLFLDEIGDMSLEVQPKILRFLESNEVHPIGETQPQRVDVRVIAATNVGLDTLVADGRFREDLFYRLNIVRLHIPPLRERRVEIPALAHHYLQKFAQEYRKGDLRLSEDTMDYLVLYRWPGNVRQLANEMRRLAAMAETGAVLMPEHLSPDIAASRRTIPVSERVLEATEVIVRLDQPMAAAMEHVERAMIQHALKQTGGRMEETATLLGVSRKGLYLKRQRFGIDPPIENAADGAA